MRQNFHSFILNRYIYSQTAYFNVLSALTRFTDLSIHWWYLWL